MKKNGNTARSSRPARRGRKTTVKDLKPGAGVRGGLSIVKVVDKATPKL